MKRQQISRRRALSGLAALAAVPGNANRVWAGSEEPISVGVLTEATGGHLGSYLQGFASARGVGRVAVSDPTGKKFDQAKSILGDRSGRVSIGATGKCCRRPGPSWWW